jgi:hypothetical protein
MEVGRNLRLMQARLMRALLLVAALAQAAYPQGRGGPPQPLATGKAGAPIDITGYWVSQIVDEWRFRVTPQKGDILYLPLNAEARKVANAWDPDKDQADGKQCKAYGAVGVMQRPGRLHITWENDNTLRMDFDAGTQTRLFHFGPPSSQRGEPSLQGYSVAQWRALGRVVFDLGGLGFAPSLPGRNQGAPGQNGDLQAVTTNMLPGYIRKNGVPHSEKAILTEYFERLTGANNDVYLAVTAMVADPTYFTQPFVRTYQFKQTPDATGWDPTPCSAR